MKNASQSLTHPPVYQSPPRRGARSFPFFIPTKWGNCLETLPGQLVAEVKPCRQDAYQTHSRRLFVSNSFFVFLIFHEKRKITTRTDATFYFPFWIFDLGIIRQEKKVSQENRKRSFKERGDAQIRHTPSLSLPELRGVRSIPILLD